MRPAHRLVAVPAERAYVPNMSLISADELLHVGIPDKRVELVRGTLVVQEPPGYTHGRVTVNLAAGSPPTSRRAGGFKGRRLALRGDQARVGHRSRPSP